MTAISSEPILLRRVEVERLLGISKATIYARMAAGDFPRPLRIAPNAVRWRRDELMAWLEARERAK